MITTALCILAMQTKPDYRKNLNMFMEAERSFARTAALKGYRESFIEWFAEDGLGFNPHPVKQKEFLKGQPEETKPLKTLLSWEPKVADCASTGDLGYTTGPFKVINLGDPSVPIVNGAYFSVWQRQADGQLRVIFDLGTPMTSAPVFPLQMKVRGVPSPAFVTADLVDRAKSIINDAEADIGKSSGVELYKTLELHYNKEMTAYRPGTSPLLTELDALKWTEANPLTVKEWKVSDLRVSISADMAFAWGSYSGENKAGPVSGYWGHVWKCEVKKGWHIVADVMNVAPAKP